MYIIIIHSTQQSDKFRHFIIFFYITNPYHSGIFLKYLCDDNCQAYVLVLHYLVLMNLWYSLSYSHFQSHSSLPRETFLWFGKNVDTYLIFHSTFVLLNFRFQFIIVMEYFVSYAHLALLSCIWGAHHSSFKDRKKEENHAVLRKMPICNLPQMQDHSGL